MFLHNSPSIDPVFIARLKNLPSTVKDSGKNISLLANNLFSGLGSKTKDTFVGIAQDKIPVNLVFSPVTKGVAAAEDSATKKKYVQLEKNTAYHIEKGGVVINGKAYDVVIFDK